MDGYLALTDDEWFAALRTYYAVCYKYEDLILPGYFNFLDPENITKDLTVPFEDFVTKYNLTAGVPMLFQLTENIVGNMMNIYQNM